jgi:hypothetical protein
MWENCNKRNKGYSPVCKNEKNGVRPCIATFTFSLPPYTRLINAIPKNRYSVFTTEKNIILKKCYIARPDSMEKFC